MRYTNTLPIVKVNTEGTKFITYLDGKKTMIHFGAIERYKPLRERSLKYIANS